DLTGGREKLTRTGVALGTPMYVSPEQVRGRRADARSDIYSLGATAYHLLAGRPPFAAANVCEAALRHPGGQPPALDRVRPGLPAGLAAVVHKMLAKDPARRYASWGDLLEDLARVEAALEAGRRAPAAPVPAPASSPPESGRRLRCAAA